MSRNKDEPGFAGRWSRLKREARTPGPKEPREADAEPAVPAEDTRTDAEVLAELGLPDPDSLKPGDDFTAFLAKAVPARLRNRALRRLWLSDPVLANLDSLVEYGDDFTDAATVVENLQTAYQVGRGFVDKIAALAEDDAEASADAAPKAQPEMPPEPPGEVANAGQDAGADPGEALSEENTEPVAAERKPAPRLRMRFRVAEE